MTFAPRYGVNVVTAQDVLRFLGRDGADEAFTAQVTIHLSEITLLARAYTRGRGFNAAGQPVDEISAVVLLATARLVPNAAQVESEASDGYSVRGGFHGWTLAERLVLDRYRAKAG